MGFAEAVIAAAQKGVFQFFLPFAIYFLVLIGVFFKFKPFGEWEEKPFIQLVYGLLSFFIALFIMLYGLDVYIEKFLAWVFGRAGILLMILVVAFALAAMFRAGAGGGEGG